MPGWKSMGDKFQPGTLTLVIDGEPSGVTRIPKLFKKLFAARLNRLQPGSDAREPRGYRAPALRERSAAWALPEADWPEAWAPALCREWWAAGLDGPASRVRSSLLRGKLLNRPTRWANHLTLPNLFAPGSRVPTGTRPFRMRTAWVRQRSERAQLEGRRATWGSEPVLSSRLAGTSGPRYGPRCCGSPRWRLRQRLPRVPWRR